MDQLTEVKYGAFFDEMEQLEKQAMLGKVAVKVPITGSQLWSAGRALLRHPIHEGRLLGATARRGYVGAVGTGVGGTLRGLSGATKALWETPSGRAALLGGGTLGAAGLYGLGRVHGRERAQRRMMGY